MTTTFTDNLIFELPQVNALCDLLYTKLTEKFPAKINDLQNDFVFKSIILSGTGSRTLQLSNSDTLANIVFECDKLEIFEYLQKEIGTIFSCSSIKFKNRILFYPFNFFFEIWYNPSENTELFFSGIYIQNTNNINPETIYNNSIL